MELTKENAPINNARQIDILHPDVKILFKKFVDECEQIGTPVWIYSGLRSFEFQSELRARYLTKKSEIPAAEAGRSYHNYGLAIDIYVWNEKLQKFNRKQSFEIYRTLQPIASKYGLRWLGEYSHVEMHHFDYNKIKISKLISAYNANLVDGARYVLLDEIEEKDVKETRHILVDMWSTDLDGNIIMDHRYEEAKPKPKEIRKITKVEEMKAVGIWQIIKLVADQYSLSQSVNDASFAHSQGSLMNYINNVVQSPWLEFFGDTVGDQYYFFVRKQPFDYNGWTALPSLATVKAEDVLSDDLNWYNGDVFSWYQIIPRGSFLGKQNLIFAYVTAVFFEEYAEIWGSKPNIQVSNYVNFTKIKGQSSMVDKANEDLRYMVESNMYLPFTREGTITIRGTLKYRRGYKFLYRPTGEEFYIDSISHRYQSGEDGTDFITVLKVSRGMVQSFTKAPMKADDIGYFNLIDFQNDSAGSVEVEELISVKDEINFYFDNDRSYIVDLEEDFTDNDTTSQKMRRQIEEFPNLRNELNSRNNDSIRRAVDILKNHPKAEKFICTGFIDSDSGMNSKALAKSRATTSKGYIIDAYLSKYSDYTRAELERKIHTDFNDSGTVFIPTQTSVDLEGRLSGSIEILDNQNPFGNDNIATLKTKAQARICIFTMEPYKVISKKEIRVEGINWKVRDKVFQFFINRKQNAK